MRRFHVFNSQTGDQMDLTITRFGRSVNIEYRSTLVQISTTWMVLCYALRIIPCTICAILLLGFAAFFLPRHLRGWIVGLALLGVVMSMLQPKAAIWYALTPWSWVPFFTLAMALIAMLIPAKKIDLTRCANCRYDLTANTSGICPECGTHWRIVNLKMMADNLTAMESA